MVTGYAMRARHRRIKQQRIDAFNQLTGFDFTYVAAALVEWQRSMQRATRIMACDIRKIRQWCGDGES